MEDVSNKTIVALLAIALVVTVVGTIVSVSKLGDMGGKYAVLSGAGTTSGTGQANLTIYDQATLTVSGNINFGSGYVNTSLTDATVFTDGTSGSGWLNSSGSDVSNTFSAQEIQLNNDGNVPLSVVATSNAANGLGAIFCGTSSCAIGSPLMEIRVDDSEPGTCDANYGTIQSTFTTGFITEVATASKNLCQYMNSLETKDRLDAEIKYTIPQDAKQGAKSVTLTFTGTTVAS